MAISGVDGLPMNPNVLSNTRMIGYGFCESPEVAAKFIDNWNKYDVVVCGSSWMRDSMARIGVRNVAVALQGVDYDIFKPSDYSPPRNPFVVFSGGKAEYRKGTDIVIAAMAKVMKDDPEVFLYAAWGNPWPQTMRTLEKSEYIKYVHISDDWEIQMRATLIANGVPIERVLLLPIIPNEKMVEHYHQSHLGVFPNRVEAGNNMVMCEAIASGLLVLANVSTGQWDIVGQCDSFLLEPTDTKADVKLASAIQDIKENYNKSYFAFRIARRLRLTRQACHLLIRDLISWPQCAKDLLDILEGE